MLLAAFFGGTIAAGGNLIGINMCGPTYTLAIAGTSPIVGSILGRIVFKERIRPLAWVGIVIAVAGVITVSYAPPEGDQYPYFAIGLLGAVASSIGCGLEAVCVTYAADMTDSSTACGIYRTFGSSILTLVFLLPAFGILAGDVTTGFRMIGEAFSLGNPVLWIAIAALAGGLSYLTLYKAFPKAGIAKSMTVNVTYTLWSIPIGFAFLALGISDYAITGQAIIGCVVIFIGVVMVIGNPKDLVKLRNN